MFNRITLRVLSHNTFYVDLAHALSNVQNRFCIWSFILIDLDIQTLINSIAQQKGTRKNDVSETTAS